ncbi:hypothetical protein D3C87_1332500 [compost metagenome]
MFQYVTRGGFTALPSWPVAASSCAERYCSPASPLDSRPLDSSMARLKKNTMTKAVTIPAGVVADPWENPCGRWLAVRIMASPLDACI